MKNPFFLLASLALVSCATASSGDGPAESSPTNPVRPLSPGAMAEQWRATSRFGYGPAPADAHAAAGLQGQAWVLGQLPLAAEAARHEPHIPKAFSGFQAPIPVLYAQEKASLQRRQTARQRMPGVMVETASPAPTGAPSAAPVTPEKPTRLFSQEIAPQAAAWRLWSCSHPQQENPLLARMTEFWFNHLNVSSDKGSDRAYVGHYVVNAIRPHALGHFEDLLLASAQHPAMLHYLDQVRSRAEGSAAIGHSGTPAGLNENYARELLELHTLGVDGGYTQQDVRELARILTGWTMDPKSDSGFRFNPRWHDTGDKQLLGRRFTNAGESEGVTALRMLARHPATAHRISLRLAQWFVADNPPPALVQRLTQRYLQTQGDIQAVMQTLIESPETWAAQNTLFKTPMDYACSVLTALGPAAGEAQLQQAQRFLRDAGQPVHGWLTPDGYSTTATTWQSPEALARRADFALLAGRTRPPVFAPALWIPVQTWARIAQEPADQQAGLVFASPAFMRK